MGLHTWAAQPYGPKAELQVGSCAAAQESYGPKAEHRVGSCAPAQEPYGPKETKALF